ncbi:hypothetical protein B566_EDAN017289 [Ephemera danica]|nr:hypothetical protein B566_EDAN017289 [Ephemera danica]
MNSTLAHNRTNHTTTPVEEYWDKRVLMISSGIHELGGMQWELLGCLLLGWLLVYLIICRGLLYYVTPRWEELLGPGPWIDGATQIFFAYSIGTGALPALGSYNRFYHNCYNGPGLVFLTYPEVVLKLPGAPVWAAIFFVMLVILGIDSEFCIVESFVTGVVDNWPELLRPHRRKFTLGICFLMFLLGIPMVTHGGAYIFQLMDFYSASGMSLLWVCFFQTIAISWIFGADKFVECVHQMMGIRPNQFWYVCWVFFAPFCMVGIFIFYIAQYQPIRYGQSYYYPTWAEVMGFGMSFASMLWIPGYAVYYLISQPGTVKENFHNGLKPNIKSRAKIPKGQKTSVIPMSESSAGLLSKNSSFLSKNSSFLSKNNSFLNQ